MSKIKYVKMDLFDAPKGATLIHSCNAKGVWGSGIAKEFKVRFPQAYSQYHQICGDYTQPGRTLLVWDKEYEIGCLITSNGYGDERDSKDEIIVNTTLAINELANKLALKTLKIYSNKFNSGLFGVPWEETEKILGVFVKRYSLDWTVCLKE